MRAFVVFLLALPPILSYLCKSSVVQPNCSQACLMDFLVLSDKVYEYKFAKNALLTLLR